jgi:hypothetical protein
MRFTPVIDILNFFRCNYTTNDVTSDKIISKYSNSGINYKEKSFIALTPCSTLVE